MVIRNRIVKGFLMAAALAGGLVASGIFQEAKAQMMYDQTWVQPVQQPVVQGPQAYPPQQYTYGYSAPKKYRNYVNASGRYYGHGRYYGPRGYGYGYACPWW